MGLKPKPVPPASLEDEELEAELEFLQEKFPVKEKQNYDRKRFIRLLAKRAGFEFYDAEIFMYVFEKLLMDLFKKDCVFEIPSLFTFELGRIKAKVIPAGPAKGSYPERKFAKVSMAEYVRLELNKYFDQNNLLDSEEIQNEED